MSNSPDIVIIGSGIGGATLASSLADTDKNIVILERGEFLKDCPEARDEDAIFKQNFFKPKENWLDKNNQLFNPGNYYYVGGNSKFYGAVMLRFREEDFSNLEHIEGYSPEWPVGYKDMEPWYQKAETLYQVRGALDEDPTEPFHEKDYTFKPAPHEKSIEIVKQKLKLLGVSASGLPLAINIDKWLERSSDPWDAFPDTTQAKVDAEYILKAVLDKPNLNLINNALVDQLIICEKTKKIKQVNYQKDGKHYHLKANIFILSAGAVNSSAILLKSANEFYPSGLSNDSDQVGRNFMNHNCTAMMAINPLKKNTAIYQKTLYFNDFYLKGGPNGEPLGNIQLLGKVSPSILASQTFLPLPIASFIANRSVDWYAMSEDLPRSENRVTIENDNIKLNWTASNEKAHHLLVKKAKKIFKQAGYLIVLTKKFDKRTPSHQCGTTRFGNNPKKDVLDLSCKSYQHSNLFVVDSGFFPSSAAVNPSLTIAAQALKVGKYIKDGVLNG